MLNPQHNWCSGTLNLLSCSCFCKVCSLIRTTSNTCMARLGKFYSAFSYLEKHVFKIYTLSALSVQQLQIVGSGHTLLSRAIMASAKSNSGNWTTTSHHTTINRRAHHTAWLIIMRMRVFRRVKMADYARSGIIPEALDPCNEAFIHKISGLSCPLSTPYHL